MEQATPVFFSDIFKAPLAEIAVKSTGPVAVAKEDIAPAITIVIAQGEPGPLHEILAAEVFLERNGVRPGNAEAGRVKGGESRFGGSDGGEQG